MAGIHKMARAAGIKDSQAYALFSAILEEVKQGRRVLIKDFGSFFQSKRQARTIYSPQIPGGQADVPERTLIRFRASPATRAVLNGEEE